MEVQIDFTLPGACAATPLDVDDVAAVEDRHVHGVTGLVTELLEVGGRNGAQLHRIDGRKAEVEHARSEAVPPCRGILLQVPEPSQGRHIPVRCTAAETDDTGELADAEQRLRRGEGSEDAKPALE